MLETAPAWVGKAKEGLDAVDGSGTAWGVLIRFVVKYEAHYRTPGSMVSPCYVLASCCSN